MRCALLLLLVTALPLQAEPLEASLRRSAQRKEPSHLGADADVQQLADEAASLYRAGNLPSAVDRYDRAAAAAFRSGAAGRAFEFALVAAELQHASGELFDAANRFERAALANANDPRAPIAHFAACQALLHRIRIHRETQQAERLDQMLDQHTANWPLAKTAGEARWQRVELLALRHEWSMLLTAVRLVATTDPHHVRSQELLVTAHAGLLESASSEQEHAARLGDMTDDLETIILGTARRWPTSWHPLQRRAAQVLGRGHLSRGEAGIDYVTQLLSMATRSATSEEDRLIVVHATGLLLQGSLDEADRALTPLVPDALTRRALLRTTQERLAAANPTAWPNEADRLRKTICTLNAAQSAGRMDQAQALASVGQLDEAVRQLEEPIAQRPNDPRLQTARAELLTTSDTPKDLERALRHWHAIETRSPRATDAWFRARLERLRLLKRLGRGEELQKLLRLTRLLAPELGGDPMRSQFNALED